VGRHSHGGREGGAQRETRAGAVSGDSVPEKQGTAYFEEPTSGTVHCGEGGAQKH